MARPLRFDAAWQRRRRIAGWWRRLSWVLVLAVCVGAWLWTRAAGGGWPTWGGEWDTMDLRVTVCADQHSAACLVDGDTLMLGQRRIRLTGFDAPEMDGACEAERLLARRARAALADWMSDAPFDLDGGADPPHDQYGRELRAARRMAAGETVWLADHMIDSGLARDNGWGAGPAAWCG